MKKILFFLLPFSLIGQSTLLVPSQYNLIQEAIDASSNGDTIAVSSGTYYENLDFNEKDLVLVSDFIINNDTNYINSTIIDGMNNGRVLNINNNTASVIGFTITNGSHPGGAGIYTSEANIVLSDLKIINNDASDDGGGIHCHASSMDLRNSKILSNTAQVFGGGVFVENCTTQSVNIINSVISNNQCLSNGGGIYIGNSTVTIDSCQVTNNNSTQNSGTHGGGISIWLESDVSIEHSLIKGNVSNTGGGIYVGRSDVLLNYNDVSLNSAFNDGGGVTLSTWGSGNFNASIINCTFYDNWAAQISSNGIKVAESTGDYIITILNSIIWEKIDGFIDFVEYSNTQQPSSGVGNISLIPDLVDVSPTSPNYNLNSTSPCIDAGNPSPIYNDPNGTRNDMGAYPYEPCINNTSISYTDITVCDSYIWNDSTYTQSGTYSFTGSNNNYSMIFDGSDDYLNLGSLLNAPSENGVIFITFKLSNDFNSNNSERVSLIDKYNNLNDAPIDLRLDASSGGKLCWRIQPSDLVPNGWEYVYSTTNHWNAGQWYNIAVTWGLDGMKMYVDGTLEGSNSSTITPGTCFNDLLVGADYIWNGAASIQALNHFLDGSIDNLHVWDTVLTQQDIQNYMSCPPNGDEIGLVGYWDFEEGSGNTVYDLTSNGNDGILVNGPNYSTNVPFQSCTLINSYGCDSVAVLNLTINNTDTSFTDVNECNNYTWNDSTYTQSGTYFYSVNNIDNNYSMNFDGVNDYVDIGDAHVLDLGTDDLSISFDIKISPSNNMNGNGQVVCKRSYSNGAGYGVYVDPNTYTIEAEILTASFDTHISSLVAINDGNWHNYTAVYDRDGDCSVYIDGVLTNTQSIASYNINLDNNEPFTMGWFAPDINYNASANDRYLDGEIDNLQIWKKSLSYNEIQTYIECSPTGSEIDLVGYWNFEEGSGNTVYDQTNNGNDGIINGSSYNTDVPLQSCALTNSYGCDSVAVLNLTINNADTSYTDITACNSYTWNDSTYNQSGTYYSNTVDINNNTSILFEESKCIEININSISDSVFTLTSWIKTDNQDNGYIFMNGVNGWTNDFNFAIQYNSGLIELNVITPSGFHFANSSTNISDNEWYFITFVYENNTAKLFVNGNEEISINNLPSINNDLYPLIIGSKTSSQCSNDDGSGSVFNGLVDDVAIWNTSLDQTQIQFYMTCPPNGNEIDLLGYWNFEEGTGNIVYDLTSNGNDGTINGAIYSTDAPLYTCALTNQLGCDSLAVLNLIINNTDTSIIDITACDSYTWNDSTYTESGTYYSNTVDINNNYSMLFDGSNDYAQISNLTHYNSFSSMCWFNFNSLSQYDAIMQHKGTCNNASGWYIGVHNGFLRVFKHIGNCTNNCPNYPNSSCNFNILTNIAINTSQWYHIALVSDGSNNIIYLDGDSILNIYESTPYPTQNSPFTIGAHSEGNWFYSDINIDDVTYFNSVLSQSDIQSYMNCSPNGNEQNLILYWNFEEGTGNTVYDQTSNGNDGTTNGAIYSTNAPLYTCALTNAVGCDSTAVLNLTINQADTSYTSVTACDSYTWNDSTYTQSGIYSYNGQNNFSNDYSMSFDGTANKYITLSNPINFGYNSFTVSIDCYLNAFEGNDPENYSYIVGVPLVGATNDHGFKIQTLSSNVNNGGFSAHINDAGNQYFNLIEIDNSDSINVILNKWYNLTIVVDRDNDIFKFYVDGNLIGSEVISIYFGDVDSGVPISIGHMSANNTSRLNGQTDNLHIWDKALSIQEIQQYMNCPPVGSESGLVGYWNFEEGSGNTVLDLTLNGNNGAINGATYDINVPTQSCALTNSYGCDSVAVINLTINNTDTSYTSVTACDSVVWNGTTYTQSGTYSYSGTSNNYSMGFDNNGEYLNSNVNTTSSQDATWMGWFYFDDLVQNGMIAQNNGYNTNGYYINTSNIPGSQNVPQTSVYLSTAIGNTNQLAQTWTNANAITSNKWHHVAISLSNGIASIYIDGLYNVAGNNFNHQIQASSADFLIGVGTDLVGSLTQVMNGDIDDISVWNTALSQAEIQQYMNCPPTGNETGLVGYWNFEEGSGSTTYDQTSNGNNVTINGATYDTNVPTQSCALTNANGCDSIAVLSLTINNSVTTTNTVSICSGDSFTVGTSTYNTDGIYTDTLTTTDGCDSTVTTTLTIDPLGCTDASAFNYDANAICDDGSCIAIVNGCMDSTACNYDSTANTDDGSCNYATSSMTDITACDSYTWNDSAYTQSGTYSYSGSSAVNDYSMSFDGVNDYLLLDSSLSIQNLNGVSFSLWIKNNWNITDPNSTQPQDYIFDFESNSSVVSRFNFSYGVDGVINWEVGSCQPPSWSYNIGQENQYDNEWIYITLTVDSNEKRIYINGDLKDLTYNSCPFNNFDYSGGVNRIGDNSSQNPYQPFTGKIDNFSIWNTVLTQQEIQQYMNCSPAGSEASLVGYWNFEEGTGSIAYDQTSNGNNGTINGSTYDTNVPSQSCSLINSNGCDSTAVLNLTINNSVTTTNTVSICSGDSFSVGTSTYNTDGIYTDTLTTTDGCDSTVTTTLTIDPLGCTDASAFNYDANAICDDGSCIAVVNGCMDSTACNYDSSANTDDGSCNYATSSTTDVTECDSYDWNGTTYTTSGSYTYATTNAVGCDSVATLNLTIDPSTSSTTDITACNSYSWNGTTYSSSGQYTWLGVNSNDCDSVATLNLTINSSSTSTTDVTECESYVWNGTTYTTSGSYTYTTTNAVGCDSTATLNLTINSSSTSTTDVTECDSYTWNGTTYTTSGSYTYVTTNAVGCDSIATINLTLYESIIVDTVFSICKGDSVSINNIWYTQADTVTNYLYTAHNCDSVVTSTIEVTDSLKCNITRTDDYLLAETMGGTPPYYYLWSTGDTTQNLFPTVNGTYWVVISDSYGCSSDTCFFNIDWIPSFTSDYSIKNLYIYPNPTRNIFNIEFSSLLAQDLEIKVRNSIGEIIFYQSLYGFNTKYKKKISLKNRSKGIYFIEIHTNNGIIHNKIILQ